MPNDWSWYIEYGTEMDLNTNGQMRPTPPRPVVTGTNLVTNCWKGKIQLRRYPTRILLEEVDCQFYTDTNRPCHWKCPMRPHETIDELMKQIFNGRVSRATAEKAVFDYEMPARLKTIDLHINLDDVEDADEGS